MAVPDENRAPPQHKTMKVSKSGDKKVFLVAQELKLAKVLAGNDKKARDKALKSLKAWFTKRTQTMPFTQDDFQRIWKGLFYSMWMSDKPLVQEECAENISHLVHFPTLDTSLMFFQAGIVVLCNEWFGIDQHRLDKFLMLVRRLLRQMLFALKKYSFNLKNITKFNEVLSETILNVSAQPPLGLFRHFVDIFMEELAKVSEGNIDPNLVVELVKPFIKKMVTLDNGKLIDHITKNIFVYLIKQSDLGLEYEEKYAAWKQQGFPGSINSMQKQKLDDDEIMSPDEDEEEDTKASQQREKPLDPRAGRVDVELPQIRFNAYKMSEALKECKFNPKSTTKARKTVSFLETKFFKLSQGTYTVGPKKLNIENLNERIDIRKEAKKLIKFEQKLMGKGKKRKLEEGHGDIKKAKTARSNDATEEIDEGSRPVEKRNRGKEKNIQVDKESTNLLKIEEKAIDKRNLKRERTNSVDVIETESSKRKKTDNATSKSAKTLQTKDKLRNKPLKTSSKKDSKPKKKTVIDNIECIFERNSGTWIVFDESKHKQNDPPLLPGGIDDTVSVSTENSDWSVENAQVKTLGSSSQTPKQSPEKSSTSTNKSPKKLKKSPEKALMVSSTPSSSPEKLDNGIEKSGMTPTQLFETPPNQKKRFFPNSPWEEPLQEGEYEITIPSKKYLAKQKEAVPKSEQQVHNIVSNAIRKIEDKNRVSLDPNLLRDPFVKVSSSTKKVKFNTKLNMSQEVYEHHIQVRRSPGIPYDSAKKPAKPLLKKRVSTTPVDPFYSKQLSFY